MVRKVIPIFFLVIFILHFPPNIHYFRGNESQEMNRYVVSPNHTLTIKNVTVRDGGKFACTIGNRANLKRKEALLCVKSSKFPNAKIQFRHFGTGSSMCFLCSAAKDALYCYCGPEKGVMNTCPGITKMPTLENGIPIHTIGIACGAAGAYIILVAILLAYCRYRRRRFAAKSALQEVNGKHSDLRRRSNVLLPSAYLF